MTIDNAHVFSSRSIGIGLGHGLHTAYRPQATGAMKTGSSRFTMIISGLQVEIIQEVRCPLSLIVVPCFLYDSLTDCKLPIVIILHQEGIERSRSILPHHSSHHACLFPARGNRRGVTKRRGAGRKRIVGWLQMTEHLISETVNNRASDDPCPGDVVLPLRSREHLIAWLAAARQQMEETNLGLDRVNQHRRLLNMIFAW